MAEKKDYKYYAFISYNHQDEKIAKKLQYQLEHYKLPSVARKEIDEDVMLYPIFRYVSDLGIAVLRDPVKENRRIVKKIIGEHIKGELEASKYLIVICSPHSAKPNLKGDHWVNDEVRHFIDIGRINYIIPVIVDGKPGDKERECFCPALAEAEIAGVDLQEEKESVCVQKIVAKLLGLMPDMLIQRFRQDQKLRRLKLLWYFLLPLLLLVVTAGLFMFDSTRLVTRYYADYVDSFGLPEGIYELSKDQIVGRNFHYRFEFKGYQYGNSPHADSAGTSWFGFRRKLMRVVQAASSGFPREVNIIEYSNRPAIQNFEYDRDNRLIKIFYRRYDVEGQLSRIEERLEFYNENNVTNGLVRFFYYRDGSLNFAYRVPVSVLGDGKFANSKSEIMQHILARDKLGRVRRRYFLNSSGAKVSDADGIFGAEYVYDDIGRKVEEWYLAPGLDVNSLERKANRIGIAGKKYRYRDNMLLSVETVNPEGMPVLNQDGWMVREITEWDPFGNPQCEVFKDMRGRGMLSQVHGYSQCRRKYDSYGNVTNTSFHSCNGCLVNNFTDCVAGYVSDYDEQCCVTNRWYYGIDNRPVCIKLGFKGSYFVYDEKGELVKTAWYGLDNKLTCNVLGYAQLIQLYDARNKLLNVFYLDTDGKLVTGKFGCAGYQLEYGDSGNILRRSYYGSNGELCTTMLGYAESRHKYDIRGNEILVAFYGVKGDPATCKDLGVHKIKKQYDVYGNITTQLYYNVDSKITSCKDGNAGWIAEYDQGRPIKYCWIQSDGGLMQNSEGIAEQRSKYDSYGTLAELSFYGVKGEPVLCSNGFALLSRQCDPYGFIKEESYYGLKGELVLNKEKEYAGFRTEYDVFRRGKRVYYDENGCVIKSVGHVVAASIVPESNAAKLGVKVGDILCEFGEYNITAPEDFSAVSASIQKMYDRKKRLIFARRNGTEYLILSFDFAEGIMGVQLADVEILFKNYQKVLQAYNNYKKHGVK